MIDPRTCEAVAIAYVKQYLEQCEAVDSEEKANVLMKLCSVAAAITAHEVGIPDAVERLRGTALFIEGYEQRRKQND